MSSQPSQSFDILIVEDNPADVRLLREALREGPAQKRLHVASDGMMALEFLSRQGSFAGVPVPHLILLDLNLPRRNGCEVLEEMRRQKELRAIPTIMFSSSSAPDDIERAYQAQANCFVTKPSNLDDYFAAVRHIEDFWLTTAQLPNSRSEF